MLPMHIFLIGMAGCGKTTLGRRIAENLSIPFVDTDVRVCEMLGLNIHEVFGRFGEPFFRNAEAGVLMELIGKQPHIVSTGGGLPTVKENVLLMQNHGIIIHIDRPIDQILSDIKTNRRPDLENASNEDIIAQYNQNIGHYRACADYTLDNSKGTIIGASNLSNLVLSLH